MAKKFYGLVSRKRPDITKWHRRNRPRKDPAPAFRKTEAYIQHFLFYKLLNAGIECAPEFTDGGNRYDLMVLRELEPLCIIEVKPSASSIDDEQIQSYERNSYGVPLLMCVGQHMIDFTLERVHELYKKEKAVA